MNRLLAATAIAAFAVALGCLAAGAADRSLFLDYPSGKSDAQAGPKSLLLDPNSGSLDVSGAKTSIAPEKPSRDVYANGAVRAEGFMRDGLRTGQWTYYKPDGSVQFRTVFREGKRVRPPARTVSRPDLGLVLSIPPGYEGGGSPGTRDVIGAYYDLDDAGRITIIEIIDHGSTIPMDKPMSAAELEASRKKYAAGVTDATATVTVESYRADWKGLRVWGCSYHTRWQYGTALGRAVLVPLAPHAIEIGVTGTADRQEEIDKTLQGVLDSLEGRDLRAGSYRTLGWVAGVALLPLLATAVTLILVARARRRRKAAAKAEYLQIDDGRP